MYTLFHKHRRLLSVGFLFSASLFFWACEDDDPRSRSGREEELITRVKLILTLNNEKTIYIWTSDKSASNSDPTSVDTIKLVENMTYKLSLLLLNQKDDVTEEIEEEKEEHLFVFLPEDVNLTYTYEDEDSNAKPIGLAGTVVTTTASEGTLRVVLRHEPDSKDAPTDLSKVGGTTDIDIKFPVCVGECKGFTTPRSTRYEVVFTSTWSKSTHPMNFPTRNPHFTPLIGATHNSSLTLWSVGNTIGQNATAGMESMAEGGTTPALTSDIRAAITKGTAADVLSSSGISTPSGMTSFGFDINRSHPEVTLVCMLAPSSDWFIGVHNMALFENGSWVGEKSIDLRVYDAGTEQDAKVFSLNNSDENPKRPISRLTHAETNFSDGFPKIGTMVFTRKDDRE